MTITTPTERDAVRDRASAIRREADKLERLVGPERRCIMCGAEAGAPCTVISGGGGLNPGDPRPSPHFYR